MALQLDLMQLNSGKCFQAMCFHLARRRFPDAQAVNFASWDGGRDILRFPPVRGSGDVIWQCKFTNNLGATTRRAVRESLQCLDGNTTKAGSKQRARHQVARWILCLPIDPTGVFLDWLREEMAGRPFKWNVWGQAELLLMLEEYPEVLQSFFYERYAELRTLFQTEELELVLLRLDPSCGWRQPRPKVLHFSTSGDVSSQDLLLDLVIRNHGRLETVLTGVVAHVRDSVRVLHGVPGKGLLRSQVTYRVSLHGGQAGDYEQDCEEMLRIPGEQLERFKVRLVDTGYAWHGAVQLGLRYGKGCILDLPWIRLFT